MLYNNLPGVNIPQLRMIRTQVVSPHIKSACLTFQERRCHLAQGEGIKMQSLSAIISSCLSGRGGGAEPGSHPLDMLEGPSGISDQRPAVSENEVCRVPYFSPPFPSVSSSPQWRSPAYGPMHFVRMEPFNTLGLNQGWGSVELWGGKETIRNARSAFKNAGAGASWVSGCRTSMASGQGSQSTVSPQASGNHLHGPSCADLDVRRDLLRRFATGPNRRRKSGIMRPGACNGNQVFFVNPNPTHHNAYDRIPSQPGSFYGTPRFFENKKRVF